MECNTKIGALCDEARAIGKKTAYQRIRRYALELLRANSGDIVTALVMRNLLAAIDGFDREAEAEFAAAAEEFARIANADTNAAKEAVSQ